MMTGTLDVTCWNMYAPSVPVGDPLVPTLRYDLAELGG